MLLAKCVFMQGPDHRSVKGDCGSNSNRKISRNNAEIASYNLRIAGSSE